MPKKAKQESQAEQSARFKREARKMIAAGELNPTDAQDALARLVATQKKGDSAGKG